MIDAKKRELIVTHTARAGAMSKYSTSKKRFAAKQIGRLLQNVGYTGWHFEDLLRVTFNVTRKLKYTYVDVIVEFGGFDAHTTVWGLTASQIVTLVRELNALEPRMLLGDL